MAGNGNVAWRKLRSVFIPKKTDYIPDLPHYEKTPVEITLNDHKLTLDTKKTIWTIDNVPGAIPKGEIDERDKVIAELKKKNTTLEEEKNLLEYKIEILLEMVCYCAFFTIFLFYLSFVQLAANELDHKMFMKALNVAQNKIDEYKILQSKTKSSQQQ